MPSPNADLLILADEATGHQVYIHMLTYRLAWGGTLESEILLDASMLIILLIWCKSRRPGTCSLSRRKLGGGPTFR